MIRKLQFSLLPGRYAICRLPGQSPVPEWAWREAGFWSVTRTADELSIVGEEDRVPSEVQAARGWVCLKLEGPFAFSETGILSSVLAPLAESGIGIFAMSTFDTDYVLIQASSWAKAAEVLRAAGLSSP